MADKPTQVEFSVGDIVELIPGQRTGVAQELELNTPYKVENTSLVYAQCICINDRWYSSSRFRKANLVQKCLETIDSGYLPDSGARSEFATGAVRDAMEGKGTPSLIPLDALRAVARRFEDGAAKYSTRNWEKGIPLSRFIDSLYRHLWAFMEGDHEEDHAGAIIWNAMCLHQTNVWINQGKLPKSLDDLSASLSHGVSND